MVRLFPLALQFSLAVAGAAQVHPGQVAPPLAVQWTGGTAIALRGDDAPSALVVAFHRSAAAAVLDADVLRDLATRYGSHGARMCVVLPEAVAELPKQLADLRIAVDAEGSARQLWLAEQLDFYVAVVCKDRIAWVGRPGQGLCAAVRAAVDGALDPATSGEVFRRRIFLLATYGNASGTVARDLAQQLIADCPTDGPSWALCYLAEAKKLGDKAAANTTAGAAIEALAAEPRALASFADLVLRGDTRNRQLGRQLADALAAAATAYPDDLRVLLARLRALVRAGDSREVGRFAHRIARKVEGVANAALEYVEILTQDEQPIVHKDLAARLLAAAAGCADARALAAVRYAAALRCDEDPTRAREIASDFMEQLAGRTVLNNTAWELMTELPTLGRFDLFALALAQRMLDQRPVLEAFELDTVALAMFLNGRLDDAVELAAAAVEKSGGEGEYVERLERYRDAAAQGKAAPR